MPHSVYKKCFMGELTSNKGWTEPGAYDVKSFVDIAASNGKGAYMGRKLESPAPKPGVNKTEFGAALAGINATGNYAASKYPNSKAANFSKGRRRAFNEVTRQSQEIPGPGTYDDGLVIAKNRDPSNNQQFQLSEYANVRTTDFGRYSERFQEHFTKEQIDNFDWRKVDPNSTKGRHIMNQIKKSAIR